MILEEFLTLTDATAWVEIFLFGMLIIAAIIALSVRDLLATVAALSVYSFMSASLLAIMGAVDVALTEVALGAGITGVLLIAAIRLFDRRSVD